MLRVIGIATLVLSAFSIGIEGHAEDWPQWRGPNLDLTSDESNWRTTWPEDGLPTAWKTNVGLGYSSISVVGNRLWTMGHKDGKERVYCLSTKDGKEIWSYAYEGGLVANLHKGGPGSTPTIDGDSVYTLGKEGQLFCLSKADGSVQWKLDGPTSLNVKVPEWGFTGSPVIVDDRLFLDLGRIVAIDKRNGEILWKTAEAKAGYGSATPLTLNGTSAITVLNNEGLNLFATKTGHELAYHKWETRFETNSTSPIVIDNRQIFLSTGYQRGCTLLEIASDDGLESVYEAGTLSNHMSNSVIHDGHAYGFDGNAHRGRTVRFVCIELASGRERWSKLGMGCGSLMLCNNKLIILSEKGVLVIAEADPNKWVEISRTQAIDYRCWTVPVLANGRVYCRNDVGDVVSIDLRK